MAINQENKAVQMAKNTIDAAQRFMIALEDLRALEEERAGSGLDLTLYDVKFEGSSHKHVDGAALNAVLNTSIPAIWVFMTAGNHDDNLQKIRP